MKKIEYHFAIRYETPDGPKFFIGYAGEVMLFISHHQAEDYLDAYLENLGELEVKMQIVEVEVTIDERLSILQGGSE